MNYERERELVARAVEHEKRVVNMGTARHVAGRFFLVL
jgi:hypothetical protein